MGGSGGAVGWGTVAEGASAPEAAARAGAGPLRAPAAAVCLDVGAAAGPLCTAPGHGLEKAAGAPPGAGAAAAGPEGRGLSAPRAQRWALCHSPGSSPGFSLGQISWGQSALHPGCHVQVACRHLTPDLCLQ